MPDETMELKGKGGIDPLAGDFLEFMAVERNASPRTLANYEFALGEYRVRNTNFKDWQSCTADDFRLYLFECLNNLAGHGSNIGSTMSFDLRLITHAADREAEKWPVNRLGNRLAQ